MTSTLVLLLAGWVTFVASLAMVNIDSNMGGELLRGFEVRGCQCFLGAFVAPLAMPLATPLWAITVGANMTALLTPLVVRWPAVGRAGRILLTLGVFFACALPVVGPRVGVVRLYVGYYAWCAALLMLALGFWVVSRSLSPSKRIGDSNTPLGIEESPRGAGKDLL